MNYIKLLIITITFILVIFSLKAQEKYSMTELLEKKFEIKSEYFFEGELFLILGNDRHQYTISLDGNYKREIQKLYYCKVTIDESSCIKP